MIGTRGIALMPSRAPLVAELLGFDFDAPDGRVYRGLLTD
jgi:hypothetical protein